MCTTFRRFSREASSVLKNNMFYNIGIARKRERSKELSFCTSFGRVRAILWGKTICFMSCVGMRPRRSDRDDQKSERAEKAPFIIRGNKHPPGTHFEWYFLKRPKNSHFILCFYYFYKILFFRKMKYKKK